MFNGHKRKHKSKMDFETSLLCGVFQVKETPSQYILGRNKFKAERKALLSNVSSILSKNKIVPQNVTIGNCWENKISVKVTLKLPKKELKNTLLPLTMNFKNLLVFYFVLF